MKYDTQGSNLGKKHYIDFIWNRGFNIQKLWASVSTQNSKIRIFHACLVFIKGKDAISHIAEWYF